MDLIAYVPTFPRAGETVIGTSFKTGCGGKGANQAVMAGKLGLGQRGTHSVMVGAVGDDAFGEPFLRALEAAGVDSSSVAVLPGFSTGVAPIWVDASGENSIVVVPGANALVSPAAAIAALRKWPSAGVLLTQLEIPVETTLAAQEAAHEAGCLTILTPAPAPCTPLPPALYAVTSLLVLNVVEAATLSGIISGTDVADLARAAEVLLLRGCGAVVVTLGSRGALLLLAGEAAADATLEPAVAVAKGAVIDTTGAGDAFSGALAYFAVALESGRGKRRTALDRATLVESVRRAAYVAADSVTKRGTQSSYAERAELPEALFDFVTPFGMTALSATGPASGSAPAAGRGGVRTDRPAL